MRTRRLGKFRFGDYYISWVSIAILLLFSIAIIVLELYVAFLHAHNVLQYPIFNRMSPNTSKRNILYL